MYQPERVTKCSQLEKKTITDCRLFRRRPMSLDVIQQNLTMFTVYEPLLTVTKQTRRRGV